MSLPETISTFAYVDAPVLGNEFWTLSIKTTYYDPEVNGMYQMVRPVDVIVGGDEDDETAVALFDTFLASSGYIDYDHGGVWETTMTGYAVRMV